jgi:hypothetical protein
MVILMLLFQFSGLLLIALSIPLILGKIPPNGLYGFRVKKTMENPDIWYPVNKYSGKWLLAVGSVMVLAASVLFFVPAISIDGYSYANLAVWAIMFSMALFSSIHYLKSL